MAGMEAIVGVARAGAFRSGAFRRDRVVVEVAGARVQVEQADLSIRQPALSEPATADLAIPGGQGIIPDRGQAVRIGHGTLDNVLFSGRIVRATRSGARHIETPTYVVEAVDARADLARCVPAAGFVATSTSATSIVRGLLASAIPAPTSLGVSTTYVEAGLPVVGHFVAPHTEPITDALDRLTAQVGATWFLDARKRLHLYRQTDPQPRPSIATLTGTTAGYAGLTRTTDWAGVFARVVGAGATVTTTADAWSDDTRLPVSDLDAITDRTLVDDQLHFKRTSATSLVTVDGIPRSLVYGRPPAEPHYGEALEGANPISITGNSYWVGRVVNTLPESSFWSWMVDRKWWALPGGRIFRVESVSGVVSVTANSVWRDVFVPAVGPGAPPPTAVGAVPGGTKITAPKFELVVSADPGPRRVLPAGTPIRVAYVATSQTITDAVASLAGTAAALTTTVVDLGDAGPRDLIAACEARLAEGHPDRHVRFTLETRDPQVEIGQTLHLAVTSPGEPGGPAYLGSYPVLGVEIGGFADTSPRFGPTRTVTLGHAPRPSLWRLLHG